MQLLSLLATCVGLASAVTVTYPAGCPDSSYDNYYPENPTGSSSSCVSAPTLYCPDSNANNYLAGYASVDSSELRQRAQQLCELLTSASRAAGDAPRRTALPPALWRGAAWPPCCHKMAPLRRVAARQTQRPPRRPTLTRRTACPAALAQFRAQRSRPTLCARSRCTAAVTRLRRTTCPQSPRQAP